MRQKSPLPDPEAGIQTVKKASQSSLRQQRKESESFSAGACTWQKIHLRLQVWNLFAYGEQIMRAADCKNWRKSPKGFFDKLNPRFRIRKRGWTVLTLYGHIFAQVHAFHTEVIFRGCFFGFFLRLRSRNELAHINLFGQARKIGGQIDNHAVHVLR